MPNPDLFGRVTDHELTDDELIGVFRRALMTGGRLPPEESMLLATMTAEFLVDRLRYANLVVTERRRNA